MRGLLIALLLFGCGSRTGLGQRDPDPGRDAGPPPPGVDAGPPVTPPPPTGCELGPLRRPYVDGAPAFVFSLTRYEDPLADTEGEYLVGYAQGWSPDERGGMALLDFGLDGFGVQTPAPGEQVAARQRDFWIMQVREDDDVLDVAWLDLSGGVWEERSRTNVCVDCSSSWTALTPVLDEGRGALAYDTRDDTVVWSVAAGGGEPPRVAAFMGEGSPRLAAFQGGYVLITSSPSRLGATARFLDRDLTERARHDLALFSAGEPLGLVVRDDDVLVIASAVPGGPLLATFVDEARGAYDERTVLGEEDTILGVTAARGRGLLAFTLEGIDDVRVMVVEESSFDRWLEPTPITERGSYRRSPHVASHPDGFAVVYGGWEPGGTYGIYGRLLTCADAG